MPGRRGPSSGSEAMTPSDILAQVKAGCGDALTAAEATEKQLLFAVKPEKSVELCEILRARGFEYLNCLSGVDWIGEQQLEVVYHLSSLAFPLKVTVKVRIPRDAPVVRSVVPIWPGANWHEREVYDLFGIRFEGHPDHRRILLSEDWEGYPLRKDYVDERFVPYTPL